MLGCIHYAIWFNFTKCYCMQRLANNRWVLKIKTEKTVAKEQDRSLKRNSGKTIVYYINWIKPSLLLDFVHPSKKKNKNMTQRRQLWKIIMTIYLLLNLAHLFQYRDERKKNKSRGNNYEKWTSILKNYKQL